jgi:hypothetical protein
MALTATSVSTLLVRSGIVRVVIRCTVASVVVVTFVFRAGIVIGVLGFYGPLGTLNLSSHDEHDEALSPALVKP